MQICLYWAAVFIPMHSYCPGAPNARVKYVAHMASCLLKDRSIYHQLPVVLWSKINYLVHLDRFMHFSQNVVGVTLKRSTFATILSLLSGKISLEVSCG